MVTISFQFEFQKKQEVADDLSVCVLNILPKVSSLPSLLVINLVKVEIQIFQTVMWRHVGHLIKGSCLGASYTKLAPSLVLGRYIFSGWKICILFVTWPHETTPLRCHAYIWVRAPCSMSPNWEVWKMLRQKHESYKYVLPLKNWAD